ncbi:hypothetical protein QAD02_004421 [Eretmocerus hayati]|uniref:Uncharacterized protein n=1 Tax=Eretmocerus hayati TaxID=131215 RepID=A0ACC2NS87_9HYME|nr:hypothetical protein QAD02_004421 [Eretmocerus hayati]
MASTTLIKLITAFSLLSHNVIVNAASTTSPTEPIIRDPGNKTDIPVGKCEHMMNGAIMLNLENVGLRQLASNFTASPSIGCIDLENNGLLNVSTTAFSRIQNLLYLNLARNKISLAQISALESHSQLRTLIFDANDVSSISDDRSFYMNNTFPRLTYLYLRNLNLTGFPSLKFAPRLSHLYLSSNKLSNGSETVAFLEDAPSTLSVLDLTDNNLQGLNISKFGSSLGELRLDGNKIEKICGKTYCGEQALYLETVESLQSLSISRNGLSSIEPDAFDEIENLVHLDLSHNRIDIIRKNTFEMCGTLRNLSLESNLLIEMPDFSGCGSLTHLSLSHNKLRIVSNETFQENSGLIFVDLSYNRISTIEVEAFKNQRVLEQLDISHNRIKVFPYTWITPLTNMKILRVNDNRLENLEDLRLAYARMNSRLNHVYLQNNLITKLHTSSLYIMLRPIPNVTLEFLDSSNQSSIAVPFPNEEPEPCECRCDKMNEIDDKNSTESEVASFFG